MAKTYFIAAGRTAGALIERTLTHARALGRPPSATHRVEVLLEHPRLPAPAPFAPENAVLLNLRGVGEALQAARSTGDASHLLGWLNLAAGEMALPSLESTEPHKLRPLLRLALFVEMQQASARLLQRLKMGLTEGVKAGEGVTAFIVGAWHDPETAAYLFDMAYLTRTTLQAEGYKPQIVALVILPAQADPALYPWLRTANRLGQVPPHLPNTSFAYLPFEALASDSDSFLSIPLLDALLCAQEWPLSLSATCFN